MDMPTQFADDIMSLVQLLFWIIILVNVVVATNRLWTICKTLFDVHAEIHAVRKDLYALANRSARDQHADQSIR